MNMIWAEFKILKYFTNITKQALYNKSIKIFIFKGNIHQEHDLGLKIRNDPMLKTKI